MRNEITITPEQYHNGLDLLWGALAQCNNSNGGNVFQLAHDQIKSLQTQAAIDKERIKELEEGWANAVCNGKEQFRNINESLNHKLEMLTKCETKDHVYSACKLGIHQQCRKCLNKSEIENGGSDE